ncbi:MAG: YceD family protein [Sarcina sp.]
MKLKFSELCSKRERKKAIDLCLDLKNIEFEHETFRVLNPLEFKGEILSYDDIIIIKGKVTGKIQMECSRCLKHFSYNVHNDIDEKFTNNSNQEEDSIILVEGDELDITEIIVNNVISTLPIKKLCDENCRGLCQECGTDLNVHICNCNTQDVDIRLAKLKDLFK